MNNKSKNVQPNKTITITADTVNDNTKYSYVIRKNTNIKKGANEVNPK